MSRLSSAEPLKRVLIRKLRTSWRLLPTVSLYAVNAIWAIPAVVLMRAVRPWLLVRMRRVHYERIGHFVGDTALFLAQRMLDRPRVRSLDLYWFAGRTSNDQWARMVRRTLIVRWWVRYLLFFNHAFPGAEAHIVPFVRGTRDTDGLLARCPVRFQFTEREHEEARAWLRRRGWREGEPFVCLLVRDAAYLIAHQTNSADDSGRWNYHGYRDSDIATYADAMQALVDRGHWVIRMGKTMHQPFPISHPHVIDYPFAGDQSDLVDIWLAAHCAFFVSSGTGIDMVPVVYGRPVVFVNFVPFVHLFSFADSICVPKHLSWRSSGLPLTLREHAEHAYLRSADYEAAGIVVTDLLPSEITEGVAECHERIKGTWVSTERDVQRQTRFWQTLRGAAGFDTLHGQIHPGARVGSAWLKSMGDSFLD